MSKHTRVAEILRELTTLITAQPEVEPVAVVVGGRKVNDYRGYVMFVGYSPSSDEWVLSTRGAPKGLRPNDEETVTVGVLVAVCDTEDDMLAAFDLAAEKIRAVERVVTDDPTLGLGKGFTATIGNMAWQPLHTGKGAECNVMFDVTVKVAL